MSSRLNFHIGSPVDPTQALQVSLGNIGKYFADFQDREMRREEKEAQQKRWEAENARAEATHKMQLDEYNRKVAERDALSGVLKDPEAMKQVVEQGAFASPTALRLSNEAAAKGQLVNKDLASVAASGDPLIQKALTAQDATMRQAEALGMSTWGGPEDTAESQLGLDSDRAKVDLLERINRTASADPRYKDISRLAGAITTAQKNADVLGSAMMDSTTAAGRDAMTDAVLGESTKGQVRDWYLSGLVGRGVSPEQALSLAELYTKDMITPQERAKQRLETAKANIEMGKLVSQAFGGRGDNSPVYINGGSSDGKVEGGEGVVFKSVNDVVNYISKSPSFKGTDVLTKNTINEVDAFVTAKLDALSKDPRYASLDNQELLGLIANSVQLSGKPTGVMDDLNDKGAALRLIEDANKLADYKKGVGQKPEVKAYAERLLDTINPKQKPAKTGRLSNLTPEQQATVDAFIQNGISALTETDNVATVTDVLPRLAELSPGVGNVSSGTEQKRLAANNAEYDQWEKKIDAENNARLEAAKKQEQDRKQEEERRLSSIGPVEGELTIQGNKVARSAKNVINNLYGGVQSILGNNSEPLLDTSYNTKQISRIEAALAANKARQLQEEKERNKAVDARNKAIEDKLALTQEDVPTALPADRVPVPVKDLGFLGRLAKDMEDTDVNKLLAGFPLLGPSFTAYRNTVRYGDDAVKRIKDLTEAIPTSTTAAPVAKVIPVVDNTPAILKKNSTFVVTPGSATPKLPVPSTTAASPVVNSGSATPVGLVTNTNVPYIRGYKETAKRLEELTKAATNPKTNRVNLSRLTEAERVEYKRLAGIQ